MVEEPEVKRCQMYFLHVCETEYCKIGISRDLPKRLYSIQSACPLDSALLAYRDGNEHLERWMHLFFFKYTHRNEWFCFPDIEWALSEFVGWNDTRTQKVRRATDRFKLLTGMAARSWRKWQDGRIIAPDVSLQAVQGPADHLITPEIQAGSVVGVQTSWKEDTPPVDSGSVH